MNDAALRPGENVVAVEVHQASPDSSDLSLDLEIKAIGGQANVTADAAELDDVEARLEIPNELRHAALAVAVQRFRTTGMLDRADEALRRKAALSPDAPGVVYQQARMLGAQAMSPPPTNAIVRRLPPPWL